MEIIEGEVFSGDSVELEDKHFINRKFIDCILEYHGREVGRPNPDERLPSRVLWPCPPHIALPARRRSDAILPFGLGRPLANAPPLLSESSSPG